MSSERPAPAETPPIPTGTSPEGADVVAFVTRIGLGVRWAPVDGPTALPGITIAAGELVLDPDRRWYAGDVLHEAGHLALLPPEVRASASGRLDEATGRDLELGALCWSYAAAVHLGIDPAVVFHHDGYRGDADWLLGTFAGGHAPGLPLLEWAGLTWAPGREPDGEAPFPIMRRWLREGPAPT